MHSIKETSIDMVDPSPNNLKVPRGFERADGHLPDARRQILQTRGSILPQGPTYPPLSADGLSLTFCIPGNDTDRLDVAGTSGQSAIIGEPGFSAEVDRDAITTRQSCSQGETGNVVPQSPKEQGPLAFDRTISSHDTAYTDKESICSSPRDRLSNGISSRHAAPRTVMPLPLDQATDNDANASPTLPHAPDDVAHEIEKLLDVLTMESFDAVSDQIIAMVNRSENERDGRTLTILARLIVDRTTNRSALSEIHALLCRRLCTDISPNIQDDSVKYDDGRPITGGILFRKYLINRCQDGFERGSPAVYGEAKSGEATSNSDKYNAAQKQRDLGLIRFIGELFRVQLLTERIMHECIRGFLTNVEDPEEYVVEKLCQLLVVVGSALDTNKARYHMDIYFSRMTKLAGSPAISSRIRCMLQVRPRLLASLQFRTLTEIDRKVCD
jgi:hypothetical protein